MDVGGPAHRSVPRRKEFGVAVGTYSFCFCFCSLWSHVSQATHLGFRQQAIGCRATKVAAGIPLLNRQCQFEERERTGSCGRGFLKLEE